MKKIGLGLILTGSLLFANYATVSKIVDGDTVYFKAQGEEIKCRVAYIDTPEKSRNKKAKRDANNCNGLTLDTMVDAGKQATSYAKQYFKTGSKHKINIIDKDRYGRSVCEIGGYNKQIVHDGYAIPYMQYIPSSKKREFAQAAKEAKRNRAGLWRTHQSVMQCMSK
jgi:endonuclease YncB( thermonuclease family)